MKEWNERGSTISVEAYNKFEIICIHQNMYHPYADLGVDISRT